MSPINLIFLERECNTSSFSILCKSPNLNLSKSNNEVHFDIAYTNFNNCLIKIYISIKTHEIGYAIKFERNKLRQNGNEISCLNKQHVHFL